MDDGAPQLDGVEDAFALTPAQAGMLFHTLASPGRGVYVGVIEALLPAGLDLAAFRGAWADVIARHQALRSQFVWERLDAPVQVVRDAVEPVWEETSGEIDPDRWAERLQTRGVALDRAPALRLALHHRADGRRHFALVCHHALVDDWSAGVVLREVAALYDARAGGRPAALPAPMPFRAFADWMAARDSVAAEAHWGRILHDVTAPTRIESERPDRDDARTGPHPERTVPVEATDRLRDVARALRVTLADLVTAAWAVVLHRWSDRDDVLFGIATTLRPPELPGIDGAVGNFVTTLPARLRLDRHATVRELIREAHAAGLAARDHAATPLGRMQDLSALPNGMPLFDTVLSMESATADAIGAGERPLFERISTRDRSHYPLAVLVFPGQALRIRLQYDPAHWKHATVGTVADMLAAALTVLPDRLDSAPADLDIMAPDARAEAARGLHDPRAPRQLGLVHEAFAACAARAPDATAIRSGDTALSYGDLDRRSAAWARALAARGLGPGDRIALLMERGPLVPLAMLAVLRTGCAYVPLDTGHGSERTRSMLGACRAAAVLTDAAGADLISADAAADAPPVYRIDGPVPTGEATPKAAGPDDLAYIMFTSGSTGAPKGVAVSHANLTWSTAARLAFYETPPEAFLLLSSFAFDSSVAGLYWTLCTGGTLVMTGPGGTADLGALCETIAACRVTHTLCLPSLLDLLADHAAPAALETLSVVIAAGEPLTRPTVERCRRALPGARLYNEYGPTEATVWCAACEVRGSDHGPVPIGGPVPGGRLVLRDRRGRPVPAGLPAELLVGGPGVAAGYADRPDLTADRFVADRLTADPEGARLYRTGDLVRQRADGCLDYLGRTDDQIKIRGHRVEPAEIEAALAARPDVREAAVVAAGSGAPTALVAFVVAEPGRPLPDPRALRDHLRRALPDWMVPQRFVPLEALPRTATGKVDRTALKVPEDDAQHAIVAARTPLERDLAAIWRTVLDLDREIGVDEDFRELGGHSLLSIRLVSEIETGLGLKLPLAAIGSISTIADQAARLEAHAGPRLADAPRGAPAAVDALHPFAGLSEGEVREMHAYLAGWPGARAFEGAMIFALNRDGALPPLFWCFNGGEEFAALADALGPDQPLFGLRTGNLVLEMSPATQQRSNRRLALQALPEVLRIQPEGSIYLGGNCQGAAVAIELALALQGLGRNVALVMLMEAVPMHAYHGRVALILGRDSDYNPFTEFASPELAWSRRYRHHSVDLIPGGHGDFFDEPNLTVLAAVVAQRMAEARADTPLHLGAADCRAVLFPPDPPAPFAPGETRRMAVRARNAGRVTWGPTRESGVRLAARWLDRGDGAARHAGHADIDRPWPPGDEREMTLEVTAPRQPGTAHLQIDLVEEGVARFSERRGEAVTLEVRVDGELAGPRAAPARELGSQAADAMPAARGATADGAADIAALLDAVRAANWRGDYRATAALLADASAATPALLAELGRAQAASGALAAAERSFRRARALDPACPDALFGLGRLRLDRGRPLGALLLFRRGLRVRDDPEIRFLAGRAAAKLNLPRRALGRIRREALRLGARRH